MHQISSSVRYLKYKQQLNQRNVYYTKCIVTVFNRMEGEYEETK